MATKQPGRSARKPKVSVDKADPVDRPVDLSAELADRYAEIATLTRWLAEAEQSSKGGDWRFEWLVKVAALLRRQTLATGRFGLVRRSAQQLQDELKREGLFDAEAYLTRNPDVREAGMDALQHYLSHGIAEGRSLGF